MNYSDYERYSHYDADTEKQSEQTPQQLTATPSGKVSSAPGRDGGFPSDTHAALRRITQRVMTGESPIQFRGAINAGNSALGNRNFLQFVGRLSQQRQRHDTQAIAAQGLQGPGKPLTHQTQIQDAFGHHDISTLREHTGPEAKDALDSLGAEGFSSQGHMAFDGSPDLYTQAHEAAHGVQQAALGSSLQLKDGVGQVGDLYEEHADAVAEKVVRGESVEGLLDQVAGGPTVATVSATTDGPPLQMMPPKKEKKKQMSDEEKAAWIRKKQEKAAQLGGAVKSKKGAPPKRQVAAEPPRETKMEESDVSELKRLAAVDPNLMKILERAAELGHEVGNVEGQIYLIIGGMTYAIEGQIELLHQLFFDDSKHIIFGWCVGNKRHNKPEALTRVLSAHKSLLGDRMSVHDAAYQADWNPDMIQRHFGESADLGKVAKCATRRTADAASYIAQSQGEGVGFDTMIKETMPGKEEHVGRFAEDITSIIEDFKADPDARELLVQRTPLMEDFARHIKHPEHRKRDLDKQLEVFHSIGNRMYGEGTDKARRAELVSHSMSVLEGIAAECIKQDSATMEHLFSLTPGATDFEPAFYRKLYGAIGDSKSTEYMGAQEYEFEQFSTKHELIYIYSAEVGPFLTGSSKRRVGEIVAKPLNVAGKPIRDIITD